MVTAKHCEKRFLTEIDAANPRFSPLRAALALGQAADAESLPSAVLLPLLQGLPELDDDRCVLIAILRLAVLFQRNRSDTPIPRLRFDRNRNGLLLEVEKGWLSHNPLTESALAAEVGYWRDAGVTLTVEG